MQPDGQLRQALEELCSHGGRLEPGFIDVPAIFEPLQALLFEGILGLVAARQLTVVAKMKKRCSFQVVDHLNRP